MPVEEGLEPKTYRKRIATGKYDVRFDETESEAIHAKVFGGDMPEQVR